MNRQYCRAYPLAQLRAYDGWADVSAELPDETVVYLWDDYTVVRSPIALDADPIWSRVDADWRRFCAQKLGFAVPLELLADDGD